MRLKVARAFLALGLGALILGVVVLGLTVVGWAPFGTWTGAVAAVLLFLLAAVVIPFALAVGCWRLAPSQAPPLEDPDDE